MKKLIVASTALSTTAYASWFGPSQEVIELQNQLAQQHSNTGYWMTVAGCLALCVIIAFITGTTHDYRYGIIIRGMVEGQTLKTTAERSGHLYMSLYGLKEKMAEDVRAYLGDAAIAESVKMPRWKASINRDREKTACRADRRRL